MTEQAVGINLEGRYILLEDDTTLPIVGMMDHAGDDTNNPAECVVAIFELRNGMFSGVFIHEFDPEQIIRGRS